MPWSSSDASRHKAGLSGKSADKWSNIANAVLANTGDEGQAIRIANSKVKPSADAMRRRLKERHGSS